MRRAPLRQLAALAWRDSRTARRRLMLYMSSIALGVAALVAIDSFAANLTRSVHEQSRALLGGDLSVSARAAIPPGADSLLASLRGEGIELARSTAFVSMGVVPRSGNTRLVQVRAVTPNYPFYGEITTQPRGRWGTLHEGANALVDPSLLVSLGARVGDTLTLGYGRFAISGTLDNVPGDAGVASAIGPRVYIAAERVPETGLLQFGSRAEYSVLLRTPAGVDPERVADEIREPLRAFRLRVETVGENEEDLTEAIAQLRTFLGIVGLVALLLGGLGVASGVHAYVTRKIDTAAILRCLGATSAEVLGIYVLQAAAMGLAGALAGALLGIGIQFLVPLAVGDFLPVDLAVRIEPTAIGLGVAVGLWVALVFALRPLLQLRRVSPLQALRRDVSGEPPARRGRDWARIAVDAAIVASITLLAVTRAPTVVEGLGFAAAIAGAVVVLWAAASLLVSLARRLLRAGWPFVVRQGVANLYRPANHTRVVVIALGFGVFLVATLYQVQSSLVAQFTLSAEATRANLVFFDVQPDQVAGVDSAVRASGHPVLQRVPIVPMRIAEIEGEEVAELLERPPGTLRREPWALRREYRSTFRDSLVGSERLLAGRWGPQPGDSLPWVSLEGELAGDLDVAVGSVITWDVQGVRVPTRVTSLREVDWARFEPNFFAVLDPAALAGAPAQWVLLGDVDDAAAVGRLQRDVVRRWPNVSSIDLSLVQRTIERILGRVAVAVRFLAVLSLLIGIPVLFSAVAATRRDRIREGVLLKTLGATRGQIVRILAAEYAVLGLLGAATGVLLSTAAAWAATRWVFEVEFQPAVGMAVALALAMIGLTTGVGLLTGRDVFAETPMVALREA